MRKLFSDNYSCSYHYIDEALYFKFGRSGCSGVGRVEIDTGINHGEQVSV